MWRVVNLLGTSVPVPDRLQARREIGLPDTASEPVTVAEEQRLEFMHCHVGDESTLVEARSHGLADVIGKRFLDGFCSSG